MVISLWSSTLCFSGSEYRVSIGNQQTIKLVGEFLGLFRFDDGPLVGATVYNPLYDQYSV